MIEPLHFWIALGLLAVLIAVVGALVSVKFERMARDATEKSAELQEKLNTLALQMNQNITQTRDAMDRRLDGTAKVINDVSKSLGQLGESSRNMEALGKDIAGLQSILRSPKLRGNMSELFLEDLLSQMLADQYKMQHRFRNGDQVDAVLMLKAGLVPVDAKFPLENFRRMVDATDDESRQSLRKLFKRDVHKHVDDIATKYIRPDEGTFDFAFMYIPAENVYYETIIKDDNDTGVAIMDYALKHRVIPVSPNSFYAYLQTILLGLRGMRIEEGARKLMDQLGGVRQEWSRFEEVFRQFGVHIENSQKKYGEAQRRMEKFTGKLDQLDAIAGVTPAPTTLPGEVAETR